MAVDAGQVNVDQKTNDALRANTEAAASTTGEQYGQQAMQGIGGPSDYSAQMAQSEKALGGEEPGISGAINQRYQGLVGERIGNLANSAKLKGYETKANRLENARVMQQAKSNIVAENRRRQLEADQANERARNGALASVLGIGAMVAGTLLAGPAGGIAAKAAVDAGTSGAK